MLLCAVEARTTGRVRALTASIPPGPPFPSCSTAVLNYEDSVIHKIASRPTHVASSSCRRRY